MHECTFYVITKASYGKNKVIFLHPTRLIDRTTGIWCTVCNKLAFAMNTWEKNIGVLLPIADIAFFIVTNIVRLDYIAVLFISSSSKSYFSRFELLSQQFRPYSMFREIEKNILSHKLLKNKSKFVKIKNIRKLNWTYWCLRSNISVIIWHNG